MCGLKHFGDEYHKYIPGHTLRGCVDWNPLGDVREQSGTASHPAWVETFLGSSASSTSCHTLRGCVDWNGKQLNQHLILHCHTLRGCVDWNFTLCNLYYWPRVTPCVGVWIETIMHPRQTGQGIVTPCVGVDWNIFWTHCKCTKRSHPAWVCGLKLGSLRRIHYGRCHTLRGCVDWNNDEVNTCIDNHSHTLRGCIWIEALFTRWSSLWKNCKHSASCVFLFKLL